MNARPSTARELLDALHGPSPVAATHEFLQRGPQMMRDLLNAHDDLLAALKAIVEHEQIDGVDSWRIRYEFDYNSPLGKQARAAIQKAEHS